jgi:hypothetical protein
MNEMGVTFGRAFKVWWSFCWHSFVLMIPTSIALLIVSFSMFPADSQLRPDFLNPMGVVEIIGRMSVLWLIATTVVQVLAIKWTLRTRWSDFHLVLQPNDATPSPGVRAGDPPSQKAP